MSSRLIPAGDPAKSAVTKWRPSTDATGIGRSSPASAAEPDHDIDARIRAAFQQGRREGEAASAQLALSRIEPTFESLGRVVKELTGLRRSFRAAAEQETVKLAIAIARRVLHRELSTDPEAILGLVMAAFQKLNARETHRLRLAPSDAAAVQEQRARLDLPASLEILADASLPPGSAVFETSRGELDASVDTQLSEIDRGFADIVRRRAR
jgi:flagellar assembly protein FliH